MSAIRWSFILLVFAIAAGPAIGKISAQDVGPPPPPIICIDDELPLANGGFGNLLVRMTSFNFLLGADSVNAFNLSVAHDVGLFLFDINIEGTVLEIFPPTLFLPNFRPPGTGGFRFHDSGPVKEPISDLLPPVMSLITISDPGLIGDVNVGVDITHTFSGDLTIALTSPNGTTVTLHNMSGGAADYMFTIYDEEGGVIPDGPGSLTDYIGEDKAG